ncbi:MULTISPECIES: glycogen debranching N-terminal domain-containing protein [Streptomyces]|uniref:amylo-alpha-1,6-glucosidase n=1 Tax=unclassified Streptomyces TaxID=2593676 RepID=UPI0029B7A0E7|nr:MULTISPECIES: glycogen debranching N-terminal domain-containing protein [unclassified Streptomyces]MDX3770597.1 glycogen debranching N-terminal domain-containing protein [Streptomyces sp. AK08-01B]MDX3819071.1 glycogen debranching N-terminal domain-containing protein [Streptomyces sp. AK08-01A]
MNGTADITLVRAGTFAVLGAEGDITGRRGTSPDGLFRRDARHLSLWSLSVDGAAPTVLVPPDGDEPSVCVLTPPGTRDEPPAYTVFREQALGDGVLTERLRLVSNRADNTTAIVNLCVDSDFADQFELRSDGRHYNKDGARRTVRVESDGVTFGYARGDWLSRTTVTTAPAPDAVAPLGAEGTAHRLEWQLSLAGHGTAELLLTVAAHPHGSPAPKSLVTPSEAASVGAADTAAFVGEVQLPMPDDSPAGLAAACARGLADLATLRVPTIGPDGEELRVPGAGVPWFLTLFGRDSLLTSHFALPYRPELAADTLAALAATQGSRYDADRGEQPGRIVHEIRHGELAHFRQVPYGRYYGSVDATPLFLVLLDSYTQATGESALAARLEPHARAAIAWMFRDGGLEHDGYLRYTPDPNGLVNQNWKDSAGAICFRNGTQAEGPIAVAEAQGYAYDALVRTARLSREVWNDPGWANELDAAAAALRTRFLRDFWMPEPDFPALALDGEGRQVDSLASDAGHLLWSGILDRTHAQRVGRRLLQPDFFSGWAIRTLAAGQPGYHPLSYHRGTCWPHDNAIILLGLARCGLAPEARTLALSLLEAAAHHDNRLPEVMAGYGRAEHPKPLPYPHSCTPQAWAAATPLAILTALLHADGST